VPGYPRPRATTPTILADLATAIGSELAASLAIGTVVVTGVTHASDDVRPGDLFAALPGANAHGSRFVAAAVAAGAVAVLTDAAGAGAAADAGVPALVIADPRSVLGDVASIVYGHPSRQLRIIGLTGTAGKTSTSYLVESGLRAAGHVTGMIGTVETRIGDMVIDSVRTTPEATDLHAIFATAVENGVTALVMEVSSHALALGRVGGTRFAVGGYTNFGSDHLDFHRDAADYFAAKAMLFDGRCDVEVLNADDAAVLTLRKPATVTYSAAGDRDATWWASDITAAGYMQNFLANGAGRQVRAGVGLPGRHNVANALLALACLVAIDIDPQLAADGIAACLGVPGRIERVDAPGPVPGVVD
jgi:UDP-N-acetylmuramoyl-L-alanyl-D-glutamate--2,6-diaminopimelate ligase